MQPEGSLPNSQVPANCPYPKPSRSSPYVTSHFLKIRLNIVFQFTPAPPNWSLSLRFPAKALYIRLFSSIHATCPAYLILLDFITLTIFGEKYRSLSASLYSPLHSLLTSSPLGPNILLNILFSKKLSLYSSLNVNDHVSHPYKIILL